MNPNYYGKKYYNPAPFKIKKLTSIEHFLAKGKQKAAEFSLICFEGSQKDHVKILNLKSKFVNDPFVNWLYAEYLGKEYDFSKKLSVLEKNLKEYPDHLYTKIQIASLLIDIESDQAYDFSYPEIPYSRDELKKLELYTDEFAFFAIYLIERAIFNKDYDYAFEVYSWLLHDDYQYIIGDASDILAGFIVNSESPTLNDHSLFEPMDFAEMSPDEKVSIFDPDFDLYESLPLLSEYFEYDLNIEISEFYQLLLLSPKEMIQEGLEKINMLSMDTTAVRELNNAFAHQILELSDEFAGTMNFDLGINYLGLSAHFQLIDNLPLIFEFLTLNSFDLDELFYNDFIKWQILKPLTVLCQNEGLSQLEEFILNERVDPEYRVIGANVLGSIYLNSESGKDEIVAIFKNFYHNVKNSVEHKDFLISYFIRAVDYFEIESLDELSKEARFALDLDDPDIIEMMNDESILRVEWWKDIKEYYEALPDSEEDEDEDVLRDEDDEDEYDEDEFWGEDSFDDPEFLLDKQKELNSYKYLTQALLKSESDPDELTLNDCIFLNSFINSVEKDEEDDDDEFESGPIIKPITSGAPKVGRNDPCPCGSGQKYKKCCWIKSN